MKLKLLFLLLSSISGYSQSLHTRLKPMYKDLSILNDKTCLSIIKTISKSYKQNSIYVSKKLYEQYLDSLTLYELTNQQDIYKKDSKTSITTSNGTLIKKNITEHDWLVIYKSNFDIALINNKYNTLGNSICIPTTYDDLNYFYKQEKNSIKHYNDNRIKSYTYSTKDSKTRGLLFFHKTILPYANNGQTLSGDDMWFPVCYFYNKPTNVKMYIDTKTLWNKQTGLPYKVAQELNLSDNRIEELFSSNIYTNNIDCLYDSKTIKVYKDTIDISFYDHSAEDNDIFKFTYQNTDTIILIQKTPITKRLILRKDKIHYFELSTISTGNVGYCTIATKIDDKEYIFELKKDEKIFIYLKR